MKKRIIACLDCKDGKVIKGVNFENFRNVGDPVEAAKLYCEEGADTVVILDIAATLEGRKTFAELVKKVAEVVTVPFIVGGGMRSVEEVDAVMEAGADGISINTAAVLNPDLINLVSEKYGKGKLTVAIDAGRSEDGSYIVYIKGGTERYNLDAVEWAKEVQRRGAGEILLTSRDADGVKNGYDIEMTRAVADAVSIPVTASGGAGKLSDFYDALTEGGAEAALAASLFHFRELTIGQVKEYLAGRGVEVYGEY